MFSKMFSEPLFDISYIEKEMNAVHSEHEKNINSDGWRINRLIQSLSNEDSPYNHFGTGNLETFKNVTLAELNNQLRLFYNKYYRSNNIKLAVSSNLPLDDLQQMVKAYFTEIRLDTYISDKAMNSTAELYGNLFPVDKPFDNMNKVVWYKKLGAGKTIEVHFPLEPIHKSYKTQPYEYIAYLFNYSGSKSLLSILRDHGFANRLDGEISESYTNFAMFTISVELTQEGMANVETVIRLIFGYLNRIKQEKISADIFNEIKRINELEFNFAGKSYDITSLLTSFSGNMFFFDYQNLIIGEHLFSVYDEKVIKDALNALSLDNMLITIYSNEELVATNSTKYINFAGKSSLFEKWYGSEYKVIDLDKEFLNQLKTEQQIKLDDERILDINKDFQLRQKNNFVSEMTTLVSSCNGNTCGDDEYSDVMQNLTPTALFDEVNFKSYYKVDNTFKIPKVHVNLRALSPALKVTHQAYTKLLIYATYLEYEYTTVMSDASEAGNGFHFSFHNDGLEIDMTCYKDLTQKIMSLAVNQMFKFETDEKTFKIIVDLVKRRMTNSKLEKPFNKNKSYFKKLMTFNYTHYNDLFDTIDKVTFEDFEKFKNSFNIDMSIDVLFYGSVNKDEVKRISEDIKKHLKVISDLKELEKDPFYITNSIFLQRQLEKPITYQYKSEIDTELNHAITRFYQIGQYNYETQLYLLAYQKCIGNLFYHNLRTVQQLGYIANADYANMNNVMYYRVIVQGSKKTPREVEAIIDDVFGEASTKLNECEKDFNDVKLSIKERLTKPDESIRDRSDRILNEIYHRTFDYSKRKNLLAKLESVTHSDVVNFFNQRLLNNKARLSIHHYAGNSKVFEEVTQANVEDKEITYSGDLTVTKGLRYIKPLYMRKNFSRLNDKQIVKTTSPKLK
jgi:insulysin